MRTERKWSKLSRLDWRVGLAPNVIGRKSNKIIFIGLRSSKNYYKRPEGGVGIWEGS